MRQTTALVAANAHRCATAAELNTTAVREALERLGDNAPRVLADAGRLRLAHPTASYAELGQLADPPLSKDAVAGRIRRLVRRAGRVR